MPALASDAGHYIRRLRGIRRVLRLAWTVAITPLYVFLVIYFLPHELGHIVGALARRPGAKRPQTTFYVGSRSRFYSTPLTRQLTIQVGAPTFLAKPCVWFDWSADSTRRRRVAIALGPIFELSWLLVVWAFVHAPWSWLLAIGVIVDVAAQFVPFGPTDGALIRRPPAIHPPC